MKSCRLCLSLLWWWEAFCSLIEFKFVVIKNILNSIIFDISHVCKDASLCDLVFIPVLAMTSLLELLTKETKKQFVLIWDIVGSVAWLVILHLKELLILAAELSNWFYGHVIWNTGYTRNNLRDMHLSLHFGMVWSFTTYMFQKY